MKFKIFILCLFYSLLFPVDIYYGPGLKYTDFESAFQMAETGDHIIDCTEVDIKILPGNHWNWISFPRLNRADNSEVDAKDIFTKFHDWPLQMKLLHELDFHVSPTLEYDKICSEWNPATYYVYSSSGYKLNPQNKGDYIIEISGERLPVDYKIKTTLPAMSENWLGYWVPYSQNIKDAFGKQFNNVFAVEAEDWFYISNTQYIFEGKDVFVFDVSHLNTPSTSTIGKNVEYGKGYIIYFLEVVEGFQWQDSMQEAIMNDYPEPATFIEIQTPGYNVIDVLDIPDDIIEIGIFVGDECYAAKSVQSDKEQLLVFKKWEHRGEVPYQFRVLKKDMQVDILNTIAVYNKKLGQFENRKLMAGKTKYSIIKLNNNGVKYERKKKYYE